MADARVRPRTAADINPPATINIGIPLVRQCKWTGTAASPAMAGSVATLALMLQPSIATLKRTPTMNPHVATTTTDMMTDQALAAQEGNGKESERGRETGRGPEIEARRNTMADTMPKKQ